MITKGNEHKTVTDFSLELVESDLNLNLDF